VAVESCSCSMPAFRDSPRTGVVFLPRSTDVSPVEFKRLCLPQPRLSSPCGPEPRQKEVVSDSSPLGCPLDNYRTIDYTASPAIFVARSSPETIQVSTLTFTLTRPSLPEPWTVGGLAPPNIPLTSSSMGDQGKKTLADRALHKPFMAGTATSRHRHAMTAKVFQENEIRW
jgi:hypothetical protein